MARTKATARKTQVIEEVDPNELASQLAEQDIDSLELPDIKSHLKAFGDKAVGTRAALIAKLKQKIDEYSSVEVEELEEAEELEEPEEELEEAPVPKKGKGKGKTKVKAKVKTTVGKAKAKGKGKTAKTTVKAKTKAKVKAAVKSKGKVAKKAKNNASIKTGPSVPNQTTGPSVPEDDFLISASKLVEIIDGVLEAETENREEFYAKIFAGLKKYGVKSSKTTVKTNKPEVISLIEESEEITNEPEVDEQEEPEEVLEEPEDEEPEEITEKPEEPEEITEKPEEAKQPLKVGYNPQLGVYMEIGENPKFVWDRATVSVFAKVVEGKIVPLQKQDLKDIHLRFWHIETKGRDISAIPTQKEINDLIKINTKQPSKVTVEEIVKPLAKEPTKPLSGIKKTPVTEQAKPSPKSVKPPAKEEVVIEEVDDIEEDAPEGGDDGDIIDEVEKEVEELLEAIPTITEDMFDKFVLAQYQDGSSAADYIGVSKKAGLSENIGEQIMLQYQALADRFPHIITNAAVRKVPPKAVSLGTKAQLQAPSQRRLLKK